MISAEVVYLCFLAIDHFDDPIEKTRVLSLPGAGFFQLPAIDNIPVEDEVFAAILLEKADDFFGFGSFGPEMNVGYDDGFEICLQPVLFCSKVRCRI